jgi:hypothetical protein
MLGVLILAAAIVLSVAVAASRLGEAKRAALARFLKVTGFVVMAVASLFIGLWVAAETFAGLGGWQAAGLTAAWAVPLAALAALAWYRPGRAVPICTVLTAAVISTGVLDAVIPGWWHRGPAQAVVMFALAAAIAVLGLKRTAAAGVLLLLLGIVPVAAKLVAGAGPGLSLLTFGGSVNAVSTPVIITGALYLSSALATVRLPPAHRADTQPGELPKAA